MSKNLYIAVLASAFLIFNAVCVLARNTAPNPVELQQEEYSLKMKLRTVLIDVLKEQYLGLSVNTRYVLQHYPIVTKQSKIQRLKLPGFGTQVTITNEANQISGYIDKYERYRSLVLIIKTRLSPSVEESIARLLKDTGNIDIGGKDTFKFLVVSDELDLEIEDEPIIEDEAKQAERKKVKEDKEKGKKEKEKVDKLVKKIGEDRKEKKKRLARLFPGLNASSGPIDPRVEAEGSKHLILSRKAYYENDLNRALNEVIESINVNPYAAKSYEMLGSIYYRLKWRNLALNNWEKALALDPNNKKLSKFIMKVQNEI